MEIEKNANKKSIPDLAATIDKNIKIASIMHKEVEKHHSTKFSFEEVEENKEQSINQKESSFATDEDFENEILYYLPEILSLSSNCSKETMKEVLPDTKDYNYEKILLRLMAELSKEEISANNLLMEEGLKEEDILLLTTEIEENKRKLALLKELYLEEEKEEIDHNNKVQNKLIFMPTQSGNPCVISELKHIDSEYYPSFSNLFESIITGKFKNLKKFSPNSAVAGLFEVKDFGIRIIISRLGPNEYCVISAFTKKTDSNRDYQEQINLRASNFKKLESTLKENISNEEFMQLQATYQEELFNMLGKENKKGQVKEKKDDLK